MSRPQVGIERLPAAIDRRMSNEPRESMNCKSCRKRKIKCNRLRPACEACQLFQCPCIYDAVPKKRGPKTDVLETLLKRIDELERRLRSERRNNASLSPSGDSRIVGVEDADGDGIPQPLQPDTANLAHGNEESVVHSLTFTSAPSPTILPDVLLDTYFDRVHGKPYWILDETAARHRLQLNQIPSHLLFAVYAVSARYTAHPNGYHAAVRLSEDYALRARSAVDVDELSIDTLQTLLLLALAFTAAGKGKKAYMLLSSAISMVLALELHRELDMKVRLTPVERDMQRRLFWTCYLMDRFTACGSKRPSLIADESIVLRLPSLLPNSAALPIEGDFFQNGSNLQYYSGVEKMSQGSSGMLIDIGRILGITNRYLAVGGVKGDSHFPWHSLSNLTKIRQDLDTWASGKQDLFSSIESLFGQADSTILVLSKLIYHLIHCMIYRPFLPIDLAELVGTGQHQSWQIEATNLCFLHANAITELVEFGKQSASIEWPDFVGYCICTAGTVHVHGAHYKGGHEGEVFSASAGFLSREIQQLTELRYTWASIQHQQEILQTIYGCHSELVESIGNNFMRYSPVFQLEDFFDRYSNLGHFFNGAHISFTNVMGDPIQDTYIVDDLHAPRVPDDNLGRSRKRLSKRKVSSNSRMKLGPKPYINGAQSEVTGILRQDSKSVTSEMHQLLHNPSHMTMPQQQPFDNDMLAPFPPSIPAFSTTPFSQLPFNFSTVQRETFDPMLGIPNMGQQFGNESQVVTPGGRSDNHLTGAESEEKDPFLSLLEQLAENEHSRGGSSELDFFLSAQGQ